VAAFVLVSVLIFAVALAGGLTDDSAFTPAAKEAAHWHTDVQRPQVLGTRPETRRRRTVDRGARPRKSRRAGRLDVLFDASDKLFDLHG